MRSDVAMAYAEAGRTAAELFTAMGWTWRGGSVTPDSADLALLFVTLVGDIADSGPASNAGSGRLIAINMGDGVFTLCVEVGDVDLGGSDDDQG